jgi:hypothetical protein
MKSPSIFKYVEDLPTSQLFLAWFCYLAFVVTRRGIIYFVEYGYQATVEFLERRNKVPLKVGAAKLMLDLHDFKCVSLFSHV